MLKVRQRPGELQRSEAVSFRSLSRGVKLRQPQILSKIATSFELFARHLPTGKLERQLQVCKPSCRPLVWSFLLLSGYSPGCLFNSSPGPVRSSLIQPAAGVLRLATWSSPSQPRHPGLTTSTCRLSELPEPGGRLQGLATEVTMSPFQDVEQGLPLRRVYEPLWL